MNNNSPVATPVNIVGTNPLAPPTKVEIVQPIVTRDGMDTIPVTVWGPYTVKRQNLGGASPAAVDGVVLSGIACELRTLTGYCSDPDETAQYYLQLHQLAAVPIAPLAVPLVIFPLKGGLREFSLKQELEFNPGMVLVLSTTPTVFTAAAIPLLFFQCTFANAV